MPVDAIDRHLDQQRRRAAAAQQSSGKRSDLVIHDRLPADPAACAGVLALADQVLTLGDPLAAQQVLGPMVAAVSTRRSWPQHLLRGQAYCSAGLQAAIAPLLLRLRPAGGYLRPARAWRFGAQHVPSTCPSTGMTGTSTA
jgi:hypothetical protein